MFLAARCVTCYPGPAACPGECHARVVLAELLTILTTLFFCASYVRVAETAHQRICKLCFERLFHVTLSSIEEPVECVEWWRCLHY